MQSSEDLRGFTIIDIVREEEKLYTPYLRGKLQRVQHSAIRGFIEIHSFVFSATF